MNLLALCETFDPLLRMVIELVGDGLVIDLGWTSVIQRHLAGLI